MIITEDITVLIDSSVRIGEIHDSFASGAAYESAQV